MIKVGCVGGGRVRLWSEGGCLLSMSNHQLMVTCVKWGGEGLIYSASRDCSISAWDATDGKLVSGPHLFTLARTICTSVRRAGRDCSTWGDASDGVLVKPPTPPATHPHYFSLVRPHFPQVRVFKGHGHWVNTLALSTEHALRTGAYDHTGSAPSDPEEAQAQALQRCDFGGG